MAPEPLLRLRAADEADLAVISAMVQDALISVRDLTYDRPARRFTLVANRFRWEGQTASGVKNGGEAIAFERMLCAVTFETVEGVSYRGFRRRDDERILSLLAIRPGEKLRTLDLEFSGGATLRLTIAEINIYATDIGEAWPTAWQPDHSASDTA